MDGSPPGSSAHGILQARILQWVAIPFSRGSSRPRDWTWVSCIAGRVFTVWDMQDLPGERMDRCMDGEREVGGWNMDLLAATHPPALPPSDKVPIHPFFLTVCRPSVCFHWEYSKEGHWSSPVYIYLHGLLMRLSTLLHQSWICVDWLKRWTLIKVSCYSSVSCSQE